MDWTVHRQNRSAEGAQGAGVAALPRCLKFQYVRDFYQSVICIVHHSFLIVVAFFGLDQKSTDILAKDWRIVTKK